MGKLQILSKLFFTFCKIGAFTFGGGYAMIPLIKKEVVDINKWLEEEDFVNALAVTQAAPGAVAINTAVFIGFKIAGIVGSMACALGAVLPSFIIIVIIAMFLHSFQSLQVVKWIFAGIRPAVLGLIAAAAFGLGKTILTSRKAIFICAVSLLFLLLLDVDPIIVLAIASLTSYSFGSFGIKPRTDREKTCAVPERKGKDK